MFLSQFSYEFTLHFLGEELVLESKPTVRLYERELEPTEISEQLVYRHAFSLCQVGRQVSATLMQNHRST